MAFTGAANALHRRALTTIRISRILVVVNVEDVMKTFKNIAGAFVILIGALWMLQGSNIITGMAMSDNKEWLVIGVMLVIFGLGLLYENNRPTTRIH